MKASDWLLVLVVAIAIGVAVRYFFPSVETRVQIQTHVDSAAVRTKALEADSLRGRLETVHQELTKAERASGIWRARAMRIQAWADSAIADLADSTSDTTENLVARLDTVLTTPPDTAGRTYTDTLAVRYSFIDDLWAVRLGYQDRWATYRWNDTTTTKTEIRYRLPIEWVLPGLAAAVLVGYLLHK